jgi:hypothetical protein
MELALNRKCPHPSATEAKPHNYAFSWYVRRPFNSKLFGSLLVDRHVGDPWLIVLITCRSPIRALLRRSSLGVGESVLHDITYSGGRAPSSGFSDWPAQ